MYISNYGHILNYFGWCSCLRVSICVYIFLHVYMCLRVASCLHPTCIPIYIHVFVFICLRVIRCTYMFCIMNVRVFVFSWMTKIKSQIKKKQVLSSTWGLSLQNINLLHVFDDSRTGLKGRHVWNNFVNVCKYIHEGVQSWCPSFLPVIKWVGVRVRVGVCVFHGWTDQIIRS